MDTNKMRDISREQFEAVFGEKYPLTFAAAMSGDSKAHGDMSIAWWGWQASREAVVVELPKFEDYPAGMERDMRESLRSAIEAQGLKVAS